MLQIGYRIHIRPEWVVPLVESYGHFFQTMEVKATEKFMKDVYIQSFFAFAKKMGVERLSFQLPNKVFLNEAQCAQTCDFMSEMEPNSDVILNTYYWGEEEQDEDYLHVISRNARENSLVFALENVPVKRNLIAYLKSLRRCAMKYNFRVCLDIGTLFYSAMMDKTSDEKLFSLFENDPWWNGNVVLVHFHDYNSKGFYLNLGDGYFGKDFKPVKRLMKCFDEKCPIIFKTPVQDFGTQGIIETKAFLERMDDFNSLK